MGNTAWVCLALSADEAGPTTFGFGADWWYEAYLDGELTFDTLSHGGSGKVAVAAQDPRLCRHRFASAVGGGDLRIRPNRVV